MFLTYFSTKSESCDHYLYHIFTSKEPTYEQIEWWLKENAHDKNDETCYENIQEIKTIKLPETTEDLTELHNSDPRPEVDFI